MSQYPQIKLLVGGEWRVRDGAPILNPSDESVLGTVPHATREDMDDALAAAAKGFQVWRKMSPAKRAEIILKASALMRERVARQRAYFAAPSGESNHLLEPTA